MHYPAAFTLILAAAAPFACAAPAKRQAHTTNIEDPFPFENLDELPSLTEAQQIDLNLDHWASFRIPTNTDQYKCHLSCGMKRNLQELLSHEANSDTRHCKSD